MADAGTQITPRLSDAQLPFKAYSCACIVAVHQFQCINFLLLQFMSTPELDQIYAVINSLEVKHKHKHSMHGFFYVIPPDNTNDPS